MAGTWRRSMTTALAATLGHPAWWAMALAAFLVRGGILLVLLPVLVLPTPAALATSLQPTIQAFWFGGLSGDRLVLALEAATVVAIALVVTGLAGAWLDMAQLREAAADDELELPWAPVHASARAAVIARLVAHGPTLLAFAYAGARIVVVAYAELLSPSSTSTSVVVRVALRAPDAVALPLAAWLAGETIGSLAGRRLAAGAGLGESLWLSLRQLLSVRGLATVAVTSTAVAVAIAVFGIVAGRAWADLRMALLGSGDRIGVAVALFVLTTAWVLGLAVVAAALAWRGAAWTAEVAPAQAGAAEPAPAPAPEVFVG